MQTLEDPINERTTRPVLIPFLGEDGQPLADGLVTSILVTIRDIISSNKIRDAQEVLNANGGVLSSGTLSLLLSVDDTQAIGNSSVQPRILSVDLRATGGIRITEEILFKVRALADIS